MLFGVQHLKFASENARLLRVYVKVYRLNQPFVSECQRQSTIKRASCWKIYIYEIHILNTALDCSFLCKEAFF
jgi:hypothetical protein